MTLDQLQQQGHDVQPAPQTPPADNFNPVGQTLEQLQAQGHDVQSADNFNPVGQTLEQLQAQGHEVKPVGEPGTEAPEAEGVAGTFARRAAHSVIPTVGGVLAGAALGSAIGGPIGTVAGGIAGAMGAGYVLDSFQQRAMKALGIDDTAQLQVNAEANPTTDMVAGLAPLPVAFGVNLTEKLAARLLQGGIMGGINVGQQAYEKGPENVDPLEAGLNVGAGMAFTQARGFAKPYLAASEKAGADLGKVFRPGHPGDAAPGAADDRAAADANDVTTVAAGGAADNGPVPIPKAGTVGQPVNEWDVAAKLAGARRSFKPDENVISSTENENPAPPKSGKTGFTTGMIDPATASVLNPDYVAPPEQPNVDQPRQAPISDTLPDLQGEHAKSVLDATHEGMQNVGQGSRGELPADAFEPAKLATQDEASIPPGAKPTSFDADQAAYERKQAGGETDFAAAAVGEPAKLKVPRAAPVQDQGTSFEVGKRNAAPVQEQPAAQPTPVARPRARPTPEQAVNALPKLDMKGGTPLPDTSPFKASHGTMENLKAGIEKSRADPNNQLQREVADIAQRHYDTLATPKVYTDTIARLRAAGGKYAETANKLEAMPPGPARNQAAAKMNAGLHNQSGGVKNPAVDLKNPRVRNDRPELNVDGLKNADGKPIKTQTPEKAAKFTKAIEATQTVFNDARFHPKAGETDGETRNRAKAIVTEAARLNGGESPLKTYSMNGMDKPKEWSLLREAQKLAGGKAHTKPDAFRTNELLHRGTDGQYETFKANNKAEADAKLNPRKGEEAVAGAEAQQAKAQVSEAQAEARAEPHDDEESLYDRRIREEREDREVAVANAFKGDLSGKALDKTTAKYLAPEAEKSAGEKSAKQVVADADAARKANMARQRAAREWKAMSAAEKVMHPEKDPGTMQALTKDALMKRDQMPKSDLEGKTEKLIAGIDKKIKENAEAAKVPGERQTLAMKRPTDTVKEAIAEVKKPLTGEKGYKVGDLSKGLNSFARPPSSSGEDVGRLLQSQAELAHHQDVHNSLLLQKDVVQIPEAIRQDTEAQGRIYKAIEANKLGDLNARDKGIYDQYVGPIKHAADTIFKNIKERWPNATADEVMNHMYRITEDTLTGDKTTNRGASNDPIMGRDLRGAKPDSAKERKYFAHENADGTRTVISPDKGSGYTEWKNGKGTPVIDPNYEYKEGQMHGDKKMTGALTEEIEKAAGVKYAKNALLSAYSGLEQMMKLGNHLSLVDSFKQNPDFLSHAIPAKADGAAATAQERGYIRTKMASFKDDYYMDPQIAHMMDDYAGPGIDWFNNGFRGFSQGVTKLLFWMPTAHIANVAAHGFVARGWDWVNPAAYPRLVSTSMDAIKSVIQQDHTQTDLYMNNAGLITPGLLTAKPMEQLAQKLSVHIERNPSKWGPVADTLGVPLKKLSDMIYKGSSRVMWAVNDMILTQHVMELKLKNPEWTSRQAITQAEKLIPNYRTPTNIGTDKGFGRAFSQVIREPSVVAFGPYHYGMINAFAHMAKDLYGGTSAERTATLGNVMALGVLGFVVKPLFDKAARMITGNPDAEIHARGPLTIPYTLNEAREGRTDPMQALRDTLTVSPLLAGIQGGLGFRDWTGKAIAEPGDISAGAKGDLPAAARAAAQVTDYTARSLVSPYNTYANAQAKGIGAAGAIRDQALDIKNPSDKASRYLAHSEQHNNKQSMTRQKTGGRGPIERAINGVF
jgi:hypothetical protein